MKAVILVGGLGTRLRPLTLDTPKALVPVLNVAFLEHVLRRLAGFGIRDVVLAISHMAPAVESCFGNGSRLGMNIRYVFEKTPLGTAGAARNALGHISEACLVMNGDIFTGLDISAMKAYHDIHCAKVTIALTPVENPSSYGLVETREDGSVRSFLEKPSPSEITTNMINAGTYIVEPEVLAGISSDTQVSFERTVFPSLVPTNHIFAFVDKSYWIDIGTPAKYHQLNRDLLLGAARSVPMLTGSPVAGIIHPSARLKGPVMVAAGAEIGQNAVVTGPTIIGPSCKVEEGSIVSDSIIWQNTMIGAGCVIESSIVGCNCALGQGSHFFACTIGSRISLPKGYWQTSGQIWPGLE